MVYDRYTGKQIEEGDLLKSFDLGRFVVFDPTTPNIWWDISNSDNERFRGIDVNQPILEEKHQNIHDLLDTISINFYASPEDTYPIIQEFETGILPFEDFLIENMEKLCAIGANPHSLLERNTAKVNIGRAKRLSMRSYQHLTHHSEDWEKMSVIHPKPRKILNEELVVDYSVYENILFKVFLHRAIRYLNSRIKQTADLTSFFLDIFGCDSSFHKASSLRKDRYRALIGRAQDNDESKASSNTHATLIRIRSELIKLSHLSFLDDISNRQIGSFVYHDTNVLNSHKYYKHLKALWMELLKVRSTSDKVNLKESNNAVMTSLRAYVMSLFNYTLVKVMGYQYGRMSDDSFSYRNQSKPKISLTLDNWGVIKISCNDVEKRIIVLGGFSGVERLLDADTVIFSFYDYQKPPKSKANVYFVNPIDADSIEYCGIVIRQIILKYYSRILNESHPFEHSLTDYLQYFPTNLLCFNTKSFTYNIISFNGSSINRDDILKSVQNDSIFKKKNRKEQQRIREFLFAFVDEFTNLCERITNSIVCPNCGARMTIHNTSYLTCGHCGMVVDYKSHSEKLCLEADKGLEVKDFPNKERGMDFVLNVNKMS